MIKVLLMSAVFLIAGCTSSKGNDEIRTVKNVNIGAVKLSVPRNWKAVERHRLKYGTTFYELLSPNNEFELEIIFNDLKNMELDALVDKDLESYIEANMEGSKSKSVEGKVKTKRFGEKSDGVYARLTDKQPEPGEFVYFTQGVRLLNKNVVLFTLNSKDKDEKVLEKTLKIIDSIKID